MNGQSEFFNPPWKPRSRIFQITYICLLEPFLCHPTSSHRMIYCCDFVFLVPKFYKLGSVLGPSPALFVKCSFILPVNNAISTLRPAFYMCESIKRHSILFIGQLVYPSTNAHCFNKLKIDFLLRLIFGKFSNSFF